MTYSEPTQLTMEVPREDAKQVRVQVATEDARGLWDVALVRAGDHVHVRTIYRAHGGAAASNAHTEDWTGEDVVRVCVEVGAEVGGGFGVGLQLTLKPEPVASFEDASFEEWVEGGHLVAVDRNAGETDEELRGRLLRAHAEKAVQELSEAGERAVGAYARERITIDQARRAMALDPLGKPYGDMTLAEFNDAYNKPETDDELRARLLLVLRDRDISLNARIGVMIAADDELERVAAIHGLHRRKAAAPPITSMPPAPPRPPTHDELVAAEREAGELLGELDEFGCDDVPAVGLSGFVSGGYWKEWVRGCTDAVVTIGDGPGKQTIPLESIRFDTSMVNPVINIKAPCPECGAARIEGNPMCHVCRDGLP